MQAAPTSPLAAFADKVREVQNILLLAAPSGKDILNLLELYDGDVSAVISSVLHEDDLECSNGAGSSTGGSRSSTSGAAASSATQLALVDGRSSRKRPMTYDSNGEDAAGDTAGGGKRPAPPAPPLALEPNPDDMAEDACAAPALESEDALGDVIGPLTNVRELPADFWKQLNAAHAMNPHEHVEYSLEYAGRPSSYSYAPYDNVYDVLYDPAIGWQRAKRVRPLITGFDEEVVGSVAWLDVRVEDLDARLAEMVEHSFMTEEKAQAIKAAVESDQARLGAHWPRRFSISTLTFDVHQLEFVWPPEAAGESARFVNKGDYNSHHTFVTFEPGRLADDYVRQQQARSRYFRGSDTEEDDALWDDMSHRSLPSGVRSSLEIMQLELGTKKVFYRSPLVRTIAEPIGSFGLDVQLRSPFVDDAAAHEWAARISSPVGGLCDSEPKSKHHRPIDTRLRFKGLVELDKCSSPEVLKVLLSNSLAFATTVEVLKVSTRRLACRVSVALRPLAFVAANDGSTLSASSISLLLGRLLRRPPHPIDQRSERKIDIDHRADGARSGNAKKGDTAVRLLSALEAVSADALQQYDAKDAPEAPGLRVALRPFQAHTLGWMLTKERTLPEDMVSVTTEASQPLWYGRGVFHLWPPARGGFVMQEMGLGKTVETLALVLANPRPAGSPGTLVLCPVALLANWEAECKKMLPEAASFLVLNSSAKAKKTADDLGEYDVVVSAYTLLKGSPVLKVRWHRLVLDESTEVKGATSAKTKQVAAIRTSP